MHAFTRPSHQLRQKVRAATLRTMHHTSIYKRLILQAKSQDANNATTGTSLHTRFRENPKKGAYILNFIYGQLSKLNATYMPRRTSVVYATAATPAHISLASANIKKPINQPPQRGMPAYTRCNPKLRKRRGRTLLRGRLTFGSGGYGQPTSNHG